MPACRSGTGRLAFWLINKIHPVRVSPEVERRGLNISEYDDVLAWLDHRKTQQYESTVNTLNQLVEQRTKALQTEHDKLDTVLSSMADGLIVTGPDGTITMANPAFTQMTFASAQSLGQPIQQIVNQASLHHVIDQAIRSVGHTFSTRFDLRGRHYQASSRSVDSGSAASGVVTVIRDITGEVQAEQSRLDFISNVSHELLTPLTAVLSVALTIRPLL